MRLVATRLVRTQTLTLSLSRKQAFIPPHLFLITTNIIVINNIVVIIVTLVSLLLASLSWSIHVCSNSTRNPFLSHTLLSPVRLSL